jgi:hypothetical protein
MLIHVIKGNGKQILGQTALEVRVASSTLANAANLALGCFRLTYGTS